MVNTATGLLCIIIGLLCIHHTKATCSEPVTPPYGYPLSESKSSYDVNATYDLYCLPGYTASGESTLKCLPSGSWDSDGISCSPSEGSYPWWLLCSLVVSVIILIPCIVPRIIFCCCCKKPDEDKLGEHKNHGYTDEDEEEDDWGEEPSYRSDYKRGGGGRGGGMNTGAPEPMTNYGKNKQSQMDAMMMYKGVNRQQLQRAAMSTNY